ncbi:polysaccharide export outer membrane protein [Paraburkholderia caballeronis]|nr:polysaccharide export outer membrane protein [Paraburkholderia caballeronis]
MLHSESLFAKRAIHGSAATRGLYDADGQHAAAVRPRGGGCGPWTLAFAAAAALMSGCAAAPGMSYSSMPSAVATARAATDARTAAAKAPDGGVAGASAGAAGDQPPPNELVEITGDLVAKQRASLPTTVPDAVTKLFGKPEPYTLGPGDVLSIVVWDHPEMNMPTTSSGGGQDATTSSVVSGYTVDSTGAIQVAYVGPVQVAGLTEMQARDLVTAKLSRFLRAPQVTLRIEAYRSKRIYLDGEVRNPGLQVLNDMPMTLPEAINRAGGFTSTGDRSEVSITRNEQTVVVNIPDMIRKGVNPDNIILQNGDLVRVYSQNDSKVYVLGEVGHPGSVVLNNGRISLNDALGTAGGISQGSGDASQVYVVRGRDEGNPTVFHLDAASPASMATADSFQLKPNDIVFVDASALVRWSRVINLILPSTQAAVTTRALGY